MSQQPPAPSPGGSITRRDAFILLAAAILVAVVQLFAGVQLVGPYHSHDGSFATAALHYWRDAQAHGALFPRWSMIANSGLGSPVFFFYPPISYATAALMAAFRPDLPDATAIALACIVFRLVSALSCAAWLRRHLPPNAALAGGALYALMPYVAFVNPQIRLALAETAAGAFLPLAFLAIDLGGRRLGHIVFCLAPALAILALTHLPTTVMAGGLAVAYALFSAATWREAVGRVLAAAGGAALGLGLAAATVVPALLLMKYAHYDRFDAPFFQPVNHFLFSGQLLHEGSTPAKDAVWHAIAVFPLLVGGAGMWLTRGRRTRAQMTACATLIFAFFLLTPLSRFVYVLLPPLTKIQFPFRFILPISALGTFCFALALPVLPRRRQRLVLAAALALAAFMAVAAWSRGDRQYTDRERSDLALGDLVHDVPEYFPAGAPMAFWDIYVAQGAAAVGEEGIALTGCAAHHGLPTRRERERMIIDLQGCTGIVVLPQFYFPGWASDAGPDALGVDAPTGLLSVRVAPGTAEVTLWREILPAQTIGAATSALACLAWAALGLLLRRRRPAALAFPRATS